MGLYVQSPLGEWGMSGKPPACSVGREFSWSLLAYAGHVIAGIADGAQRAAVFGGKGLA